MAFKCKIAVLFVIVLLDGAVAFSAPQNQIDTNVYIGDAGNTGDDAGTIMNWYENYWIEHNSVMAAGLAKPMTEQLPAQLDTNGHWGAIVDGLQLSIRFHQREFKIGEPVDTMILLRNVESAPRQTLVRNWGRTRGTGEPEVRKNFSYLLRKGTNVFNWNWADPKPNGLQYPRYFWAQDMNPHSQSAFFVRLDQIFNLSHEGEYSIQVTRTERLSSGQGTTNITSGAATFQVVKELSETEIQNRKAFEEDLKETEGKAAAVRMAGMRQPPTGTSNNVPAK